MLSILCLDSIAITRINKRKLEVKNNIIATLPVHELEIDVQGSIFDAISELIIRIGEIKTSEMQSVSPFSQNICVEFY